MSIHTSAKVNIINGTNKQMFCISAISTRHVSRVPKFSTKRMYSEYFIGSNVF